MSLYGGFAIGILVSLVVMLTAHLSDNNMMNRCVKSTGEYIEYIKPYASRDAKGEEKSFLKKEFVECLTRHGILYSELQRLQSKYNVSIRPVGTMDSGFLIEPYE